MKKTLTRKQRRNLTGFLFCLPAILLGIVFLVIPIVMSVVYSFTDFYMLTPQKTEFVFLQNYTDIFNDKIFKQCIENTIYYVVISVPIQCLVALALALLINQKYKGVGVFRLAYFAPVITSATVVTILFTLFYSETDGIFNMILENLGFARQGFLNDKSQAMLCLIFMAIWQGAGYQMIIILAGLQGINTTLYEAAEIDGANSFQKFWYVTVPGIMPILAFVFIITLTGAFKMFTPAYLMTNGGPMNSTKTIVFYIYEVGLVDRQVGYGSAISVLFTLAFVVITLGFRVIKGLVERYNEKKVY